MKKNDVAGVVIYLIMLGLALVFGLTVLRVHAQNSDIQGFWYFLYILGAIVAGIVASAILLELGHIIGAATGGYNILCVTILFLSFYKVDGKRKFGFKKYDGLTGQTEIVPKKGREKDASPLAYLNLGTLFMLVFTIVMVVLFVVLNQQGPGNKTAYNTAYFLLTTAVLSGMCVIYNVMPFELDTTNDGWRLRMAVNKNNKEAFNELLLVRQRMANGEKVDELKTFTDISDFTAELNLNKIYSLLDEGKYEEATGIVDVVLNGKANISTSLYLQLKCQKVYIEIMTKSKEEAKKFYDAEISMQERRTISSMATMPTIRAYILMAALLDKSRSETERALKHLPKAYKRTPAKRRPIEAQLFNEAIDKIYDAHKSWGVEDYKINLN